jgi:hypothetical protein
MAIFVLLVFLDGVSKSYSQRPQLWVQQVFEKRPAWNADYLSYKDENIFWCSSVFGQRDLQPIEALRGGLIRCLLLMQN